eukprot:112737_1
MATCFDQQYLGRPCLLLLVWILGIFGVIFLLLGMLIDELTTASFTVGGAAEYSVTCSSSTFDQMPGPLNMKYSDTGYTQALLQKQAGSAWLAFGILSCLFIPFLLFGILTDYYSGIFDYKKPINYWKGCCMLQTLGFTRISSIFIIIFELLQIIIYSASDKCSTDAFYDEIFGGVSDLNTIGGASFVMVVMSLLFLSAIFIFILYYQYRISAELPTGGKKDNPVKFNKNALEDPNPKPQKEPTPPPVEATGQAPESEYFRPKNNVTVGGTTMSGVTVEGNTNTNNTTNKNNNRPKGPPPMPVPKPKGPPPVPPK